MKAVKKIIICTILFLGVFSLASANSDVRSIKITQYGTTKLSLVMDGISPGVEAKISLEDEKGYVLISEMVKKTSSFGKIFNLKNLPEGEYNMVVNTQTRKTIQPIVLTATDIEIDIKKRKVVFHPVIRQNENFLDVSWFAGRMASVKVIVLNGKGGTVFEDTIKNVIKVEKRYNVAQLGIGNYTVKVRTPYDMYSHELIIK